MNTLTIWLSEDGELLRKLDMDEFWNYFLIKDSTLSLTLNKAPVFPNILEAEIKLN